MEAGLGAAAAWLDMAGVRGWAAGGVYPVINTLHLLGLVMLVGSIGVVDLRVAGIWRALPAAALSRALTPIAVAGLVILALTGIPLFAADGASLATSSVFHAKLVLIAVALANAFAFRRLWRASADTIPTAARLMAIASIALWLGVGTLGRFIAYSA